MVSLNLSTSLILAWIDDGSLFNLFVQLPASLPHQIESVMQCMTVLLLMFGLVITGKQLKATLEIHRENLIWNQKVVTQVFLTEHLPSPLFLGAISQPKSISPKTAVPLEVLLEKFAESPEVRNECHAYLNALEALARGIHADIYNFDLVQLARKGTILDVYAHCKEYIQFVRREQNPLAWELLEKLAAKL